MGFIASVVAFARETVNGTSVPTTRIDAGGGNDSTAGHWASPGDDSPPLPADDAFCVDGGGTGRSGAVGYQDPKNAGRALPGERLLYARDQSGEIVLEIYMKNSGELLIESTAGRDITIKTTGTCILDAPDVRLGSMAGKQVACVGDLVAGSTPVLAAALIAAPTVPTHVVIPTPPATPTASGGVPIVGQIISGSSVTKSA